MEQSSINFKLGSILEEAWNLVRGSKLPLLLVSLVMFVIAALFQFVVYKMLGVDSKNPPYLLRFILMPIFTNILIAPFYAGAVITAIKHGRQELIGFASGFKYFKQWGPLGVAMVMIGIIASIVVWIINLPSITNLLSFTKPFVEITAGLVSTIIYSLFLLTMPLIVDKNLGVMDAFKTSVNNTKAHWPKIFVLFILIYLFLFACVLPMMLGMFLGNIFAIGLGLVIFAVAMVWLLPYTFLILGVIYRRLVV